MILIRVDANEMIGAGHVMRCLSIARALIEANQEVLFVTADHRGDELIEREGFSKVCLESDWTQLNTECGRLLELVDELKPSILFIDSYYITKQYLKILSANLPVAYMDDMNQSVWDVKYLINYNIYGAQLDYSSYCSKETELLIGTQYTPLRKEFRKTLRHEIKNTVTDIMVSTGGADPEAISEKIMNTICPAFPDIRFHFIIGALNQRIEEIKGLEKDNVFLHINVRQMAPLMKKCDLAISAAGTTLYELCAAGTPTITYVLADNQILAADAFQNKGLMLNLGDIRKDIYWTEKLKLILTSLICEEAKRVKMSQEMQRLVDGRGSQRIARRIIEGLKLQ